MKKIIVSLSFLLMFAASAFSQTTAFTVNLKDLLGNTPVSPESAQVYVELSLRNIGSATIPTLCRVNGVGVVTFPVNLYPVSGVASGTVYDETFITCAGTTGASYYHVRIIQGDNVRTLVKKTLFEDDFDIEGSSFNLNSTAPRSAGVITPPVATAVLTNPSGNQTIVQPAGTALSINHLSAGFAQNSNGSTMIPANRFTDTSPTGNFLDFLNAAGSSHLWTVDVSGTLQNGIIPIARLSSTPDTGTGTTNAITKYTNGASGVIGNSSIADNGTSVSTPEDVAINTSIGQSGANLQVRGLIGNLGNQIEFGHTNPAGYGSNIGAEFTSGDPFICFMCEAGTTVNTYRTRGNSASIIRASTSGVIQIGGVTSNNADNQAFIQGVTITSSTGAVTANNLNLNATGTLSTTAQSGTGSLCMTTSCSLTTPSVSSPTTTGTDSGTETLSGKTLTAPVINGTPSGTGIPTVTKKVGTGLGNYTTTSTTYVQVDATNLLFTVTIPTGWKMVVMAKADVTTNTAAVLMGFAIADGGTVLEETQPTASSAGTVTSGATLLAEINGNGASHTIDLRFRTSNTSDAAVVVNVAATIAPIMIFTMMPSN